MKKSIVVIDYIDAWSRINKDFYNILPEYYEKIYFFNNQIIWRPNQVDLKSDEKYFKKNFPKVKINILKSAEEYLNGNFHTAMLHTTDMSDFFVNNKSYEKLIFWKHNEYYLTRGEYKSKLHIDDITLKAADLIFCVERRDIKYLPKRIRDYKDKLIWIDNTLTVDLSKYKKEDSNIITSFGTFAIRKGAFWTQIAFNKFCKKSKDYTLHSHIAEGTEKFFFVRNAIGIYLDTNSGIIRTLSFLWSYLLRPRNNDLIVRHFSIPNEKVLEKISKSKAIIVNSSVDASSVVIREAISIGIPVFSSYVAGHMHELEDYLVIHKNASELTRNLEKYLIDDKKYKELIKKINSFNYKKSKDDWYKRFRKGIEALDDKK